MKKIVVTGAREHNLKNVDVSIPRNKLVVVTGVSGSGKSSLAFDTIYAEGQRRYVESLSSYARQFLGRMDKPDVDSIEGLSPAISIDQKGVSHNPRSTVGTVTEIYDYLRLLFARAGRLYCYQCNRLVESQTIEQIVDSILKLPAKTKFLVLAPLVRRRKGEHKDVFEMIRKNGYVRARVNGEQIDVTKSVELDKQKWHSIEVIVDRLVIEEDIDRSRIADSVDSAMNLSGGIVQVGLSEDKDIVYSDKFACVPCGVSFEEIEPRTFSFNNPHGACMACAGLGYRLEADPELVIPNNELSIYQGAIRPWSRNGSLSSWHFSMMRSLSEYMGFSLDEPIKNLKPEMLELVLYGSNKLSVSGTHINQKGKQVRFSKMFEGVIPNVERRYNETGSMYSRHDLQRYMASKECHSCKGNRLKKEALSVKVRESNIIEITEMSVKSALMWIDETANTTNKKTSGKPATNRTKGKNLTAREKIIANQILMEIKNRLEFMVDIGLEYLTLNRTSATLSGGEAQRIRLATQIGSGLTGVLYVCDEPSIGLHPADDDKLIGTLKKLRNLGNTVLIVEHDETIMRSADHIIDLGPGAGEHGGKIIAEGPLSDIKESKESITGNYLSGQKNINVPVNRRNGNGKSINILGAKENNLKNINVEIPLGMFVCVTGVSGSGKSTLINEILYKSLAQQLFGARDKPGKNEAVSNISNIDKVVNIDQSPIGRTPRSNPATYTGTFTPIRELFAKVPEARMRGYKPGRFSFNVKGGRCEACAGDGYTTIEMQFLPDVTVACEICVGARYSREALEIEYNRKNIAQVLNMTVSEAKDFFVNIPAIHNKLKTMNKVGLGYIKLGQPSTQLSGGEAQRIKLATELSKRSTGNTMYILDEPTTGLSFQDCDMLLTVLHKLVDSGNTVVLIEHHMDLIKNADWIIDLGPGAGNDGGKVLVQGTPESISTKKISDTGKYLKPLLK